MMMTYDEVKLINTIKKYLELTERIESSYFLNQDNYIKSLTIERNQVELEMLKLLIIKHYGTDSFNIITNMQYEIEKLDKIREILK